ncbi:MAG: 16S rRNA (cytidine(1402)-2'-O)-methyltransferase [Sphingomonadales bacterium]|nr:16S rRNA (cytidine(1402)-2'-O)-methyltransferase [Sphingomonadales bacterium]
MELESGLYVTATPIGNLADLSARARDVLTNADLVAAEDTRVTAKLLNHFGIATKMLAYHDHNAPAVRPRILEVLAEGGSVVLVSDAGTPLISDPGLKLVQAAIDAGHRVVPVPGASALLAALMVSGLPTDRFLFTGFLPGKHAARKTALAELARIDASLIFYESGRRLAAVLEDMAAALGVREAAVCRELTKRFEEVRRGPLAALAEGYRREAAPKGEIVVVVGPPEKAAAAGADETDLALEHALKSLSVKEAAAAVAYLTGRPRRELYARALALKEGR